MAAFASARMTTLRYGRLAPGPSPLSMPSFRPAMSPTASFSIKQRASRTVHSHWYQPRRSVLEVERKFTPTATSIRQLDRNAGDPPFESVVHKGDTVFEDTYYDTPKDALSKAGVWLRRREKFERGVRRPVGHKREGPQNASWEAKVRLAGDSINSAFREITDVQEMSAMLGALVPGLELDAHGPQDRNLQEMARLATYRTDYVVDGKFTVVIDVTDFGHTVGEVELEREVTEASCEGEDKTLVIAAMDKEIDEFMRRFLWAFPEGKPVEKLPAYFDLGHKAGRSTSG